MAVIYTKFDFGDKVKMDGGDITGVVTTFSVAGATDLVSAEVTWFHNGDVKTGWFREWRLEKTT